MKLSNKTEIAIFDALSELANDPDFNHLFHARIREKVKSVLTQAAFEMGQPIDEEMSPEVLKKITKGLLDDLEEDDLDNNWNNCCP